MNRWAHLVEQSIDMVEQACTLAHQMRVSLEERIREQEQLIALLRAELDSRSEVQRIVDAQIAEIERAEGVR